MKRSNLTTAYIFLILSCIWIVSGSEQTYAAEALSARSAVEKSEVFTGESFIFQIQVEGYDAPDGPDVSGIRDFNVQSLGGQQNSSSSITIVNGRMTEKVRRGYIFSYRLTPKEAGLLTIPSIKVSANGQTVSTQPVRIRAIKPTEIEDFKLRLELSSTKCYVGQPITLTATWYIGKDVEGFEFNLPVLADERFAVADVDTQIDPGQENLYLRIPVGDGEVIGKKGRDRLDGTQYMTVRFQKILIPIKPGTLTIPQGTVACNAVMGYQKSRQSSDPIDRFFDDDFFFGRKKRAIVKKFVIPSNEPILTVLDLPEEGKPANFTGLVGKYSIEAGAIPTEVRVGDPITLTLRVTGPDYLKNVRLPPLDQQPALARDFKIPEEMAAGKVEGRMMTFTQTLRAKHAEVKTIPPIELSYFDAETGNYALASSDAIPLNVSSTRIVTARDAEGRLLPEETKSELESWAEGIAYNYEDLSALRNQAYSPDMWINSPVWMALVGLPPLVYLILFTSVRIIRRRKADPAAQQARKAYGELVKTLHGVRSKVSGDLVRTHASVLEALRHYLGGRLRLSPGALTFSDVNDALLARRVDSDAIERLKRLFEECEASRYTGTAESTDTPTAVVERAINLVREIEESLR